MKGISTILAMILIVIIVVALIGLTYTFAVGLFGTATGGATEQTATVTERLQKSGTIVSSSCDKNIVSEQRNFTVTIKNTGTLPIKANEIAFFQDDVRVTDFDKPLTDLLAGALETYELVNSTEADDASHIIKLSVPAGEVTYSSTCSSS